MGRDGGQVADKDRLQGVQRGGGHPAVLPVVMPGLFYLCSYLRYFFKTYIRKMQKNRVM